MHHGINRGGVNRGGLRASGKRPRRESLRQSQHQPKRESEREPQRNRMSERLPTTSIAMFTARATGAIGRDRAGYWWPTGGAVAAGAALGFVSAAAAASWAGAAPGPNLCWYYTDPSRQQGFWDACP